MPEHHTWFDFLLGRVYKDLEHAAAFLGTPSLRAVPLLGTIAKWMGLDIEKDGTWIAHGHVSLQPVFATAVIIATLALLAFLGRPRVSNDAQALVPEARFSLRTFFELVVEASYGQMTAMMGPKAAKFFLPLIGTFAFLILLSNALGLIPGFLPPTSVLNTTVPYGLVIFFATHIFGVKEHGVAYFKHFFGPILLLSPLILLIELISHAVRPASLAIRLAGNMTGDHQVLSVFLGLGAPFLAPVPVYALGVLVVVVQTLVFCLLSTVYISLAIAHEEH